MIMVINFKFKRFLFKEISTIYLIYGKDYRTKDDTVLSHKNLG